MWLLVVVATALLCGLLAWSIGANDVANSFGTSVGAKALTVRQAVIVAGIFEFLGALLMGAHVAGTFKNGIIDIAVYEERPEELLLGMAATLLGAFIMVLLATVFALPVSGTHSVVGAMIGFSVAADGFSSVQWNGVFHMASAWLISPLFAGTISLCIYVLSRWAVLRRADSYFRSLVLLPPTIGFAVFINLFMILLDGAPAGFDLHFIPWWVVMLGCLGVGFAACIVSALLTPYTKKFVRARTTPTHNANQSKTSRSEDACACEEFEMRELSEDGGEGAEKEESGHGAEAREATFVDEESQAGSEVLDSTESAASIPEMVVSSATTTDGASTNGQLVGATKTAVAGGTGSDEVSREAEGAESERWHPSIGVKTKFSVIEAFNVPTEEVYGVLQVIMAMFGSFAHGANDIANAIGPFAVAIEVYEDGEVNEDTPVKWWILLGASIAVVAGLAMWGYRVMKTIGEGLAQLSKTRGFHIEFGSAMSVLLGSRAGLPLSTTHCKVGSVIGVGLGDGFNAVNWRTVGGIACGWIVTLPVSAGVSGACFLTLRWLLMPHLEGSER